MFKPSIFNRSISIRPWGACWTASTTIYKSGLILRASLTISSISKIAPVKFEACMMLKRTVFLSINLATSLGSTLPVSWLLWATLNSLPVLSAKYAAASKADGCSRTLVTILSPSIDSAMVPTILNITCEAVRPVRRDPSCVLKTIRISRCPFAICSWSFKLILWVRSGQSGNASSFPWISTAAFSLKAPPALSKKSRFPKMGSSST